MLGIARRAVEGENLSLRVVMRHLWRWRWKESNKSFKRASFFDNLFRVPPGVVKAGHGWDRNQDATD